MGLDWRPLNKPFPGKEKEYEEIFDILSGRKKQNVSFMDKLLGKEKSQEKLLEMFLKISAPAYETLNAPRVGKDKTADEWAIKQFELREDKKLSLDQFLNQMEGFYVLELVEESDGIPTYIAPHDEAHVFRAQFLNDCVEIIGKDMIEEAYTSQLPDKALDFGKRLYSFAENFAIQNNCLYLKDQRNPPEFDENSPYSKAHILFSASKWLTFWSTKGHGYEANY